ncbi:MAG: type I-MYXAN CRISPR-associated protein Cas6/Cmx6 [Betaproteobacteria bacterium]|nr:type I-MYXAN CRISPR-associated protein Cas6/Cmx6 [Betaproteobacteria bacterium]
MMAVAGSRDSGSASAVALPPEMIDVVFGLAGENLPAQYEWPLFREVARIVPWIENTPRAGILPVHGPRAADGAIMMTHRSRVVIRLPRERACSASALERRTLHVGDCAVTLGVGSFRAHQSAPTLYSPRVATGEEDETRFVAALEKELLALGVSARLICGRRVQVELEEGRVTAFPVAVHGLREIDSLLLQRAGLGRGQPVGCGLLIPHKTIIAAD